MKSTVEKLEAQGYQFTINGTKLSWRYSGRESPPSDAGKMLTLIVQNKPDAINYIQSRQMTNAEAIRLAYRGELTIAVKMELMAEWAEAWGGDVWLTPTKALWQRCTDEDPTALVLMPNEFFHVADIIAKQGSNARGAIQALRLFGGTMTDNAPRPTNDLSADISPDVIVLGIATRSALKSIK